ncbi:MAG: tRNA (guanosine(46)-N7)-methyltransferase TrmB [Bacteroidetes bacterium]|nr:MAG: tRNA (guanosine(46)-N7)-methyltransferase TrmB [Bacteroidota bacterium]
MAKQKLKRFAEFSGFPHTFDFPYHFKGKWGSEVFKNTNPIVLELGCGKGEYTIALAEVYPDKNFIGIDIKSNRMWVGANTALEKGMNNVVFMRALMHRIHELFDKEEIGEIWITFPDPFVRMRSAKHRLTHSRFLRLYRQILKLGGSINFKTDSDELFAFTLNMLQHLQITPEVIEFDVHANTTAEPLLKNVRTYYENLFMAKGKTIKFTRFTLDNFTEERALQFETWFEQERLKLVAEGKSTGI